MGATPVRFRSVAAVPHAAYADRHTIFNQTIDFSGRIGAHTMEAPALPALPDPASPPADDARQRLLMTAVRLFGAQGYASTSTRQIAAEASVNISAIRYYFGDKAGLYRAAYSEPLGDSQEDIARFADPALTPRQALVAYFQNWIEPFCHGELAQQCTQMHLREMLEPTGLWQQQIEGEIGPLHEATVAVLRRALGLARVDNELHRLAIALYGLGLQLYAARDIVEAVRPQLQVTPRNVDQTVQRLADFAESLIEGERRRRAAASGANA